MSLTGTPQIHFFAIHAVATVLPLGLSCTYRETHGLLKAQIWGLNSGDEEHCGFNLEGLIVTGSCYGFPAALWPPLNTHLGYQLRAPGLDVIAFSPPGVLHQPPNQHLKQRNSPREKGNQAQDFLQFLSVMICYLRGTMTTKLWDAEVRKEHLPRIPAELKDTGGETMYAVFPKKP